MSISRNLKSTPICQKNFLAVIQSDKGLQGFGKNYWPIFEKNYEKGVDFCSPKWYISKAQHHNI